MRELIERLKAAEPSRELDARIEAMQCGLLGALADGAITLTTSGWLAGPGAGVQPIKAPHYTTSIDAALTLVPEGWTGGGRLVGGEPYTIELSGNGYVTGKAPTPALALCIAALEARAQED